MCPPPGEQRPSHPDAAVGEGSGLGTPTHRENQTEAAEGPSKMTGVLKAVQVATHEEPDQRPSARQAEEAC